jgi:hypothetical protein
MWSLYELLIYIFIDLYKKDYKNALNAEQKQLTHLRDSTLKLKTDKIPKSYSTGYDKRDESQEKKIRIDKDVDEIEERRMKKKFKRKSEDVDFILRNQNDEEYFHINKRRRIENEDDKVEAEEKELEEPVELCFFYTTMFSFLIDLLTHPLCNTPSPPKFGLPFIFKQQLESSQETSLFFSYNNSEKYRFYIISYLIYYFKYPSSNCSYPDHFDFCYDE